MSMIQSAVKGFRVAVVPLLVTVLFHLPAVAQDIGPLEDPDEPIDIAMTAERLGELILNVDEEAQFSGSSWVFYVAGLEVGVVYDIQADRMRIVIPIGPADEISKDELLRIMQANFDSALDARYAIAQGQLWAAFIHPLGALGEEEFLIALGETVNVARSYGTSYSSGLFIYRGGDSADIQQRELIDSLKKKQT